MATLHKNANNLIGKRFGRLLVMRPLGARKRGYIVWSCRCDCGGAAQIATNNLTMGHTKSCGCLQQEVASRHMKGLHSLSKSRRNQTQKGGVIIRMFNYFFGKKAA